MLFLLTFVYVVVVVVVMAVVLELLEVVCLGRSGSCCVHCF